MPITQPKKIIGQLLKDVTVEEYSPFVGKEGKEVPGGLRAKGMFLTDDDDIVLIRFKQPKADFRLEAGRYQITAPDSAYWINYGFMLTELKISAESSEVEIKKVK